MSALIVKDDKCPGIVFEVEPTQDVINFEIAAGIDKTVAAGKQPWLLMPPRVDSVSYEDDVLVVLNYLKSAAKSFSKCNIILAVYELNRKHVTFVGEHNSVEQALKVARTFI